jgi:hypothetical protein
MQKLVSHNQPHTNVALLGKLPRTLRSLFRYVNVSLEPIHCIKVVLRISRGGYQIEKPFLNEYHVQGMYILQKNMVCNVNARGYTLIPTFIEVTSDFTW